MAETANCKEAGRITTLVDPRREANQHRAARHLKKLHRVAAEIRIECGIALFPAVDGAVGPNLN